MICTYDLFFKRYITYDAANDDETEFELVEDFRVRFTAFTSSEEKSDKLLRHVRRYCEIHFFNFPEKDNPVYSGSEINNYRALQRNNIPVHADFMSVIKFDTFGCIDGSVTVRNNLTGNTEHKEI